MRRLIVLLTALVALPVLLHGATIPSVNASQPAGGRAPSGGSIVSLTSHGVRLVLLIPGTEYPTNALVQATVSVTNLTGRDISTWDCPTSSIGAEVVGVGSFAVYPPLIPPPGAPWSGCKGATAQPRVSSARTVRPSQTYTRMGAIVLRTPSVRAWAYLRFSSTQGKPTVVETPLLHLRATSAPGPQLRLRTTPMVSAEVVAVSGAGPVLYSQFAYCRDVTHSQHPMKVAAALSRWSILPRRILLPFESPPCRSLAEWSLFVGQWGRPIAHVYYCARRDQCIYAPPTPQELAIAACKRAVADAIRTGKLPFGPDVARYAVGLTSTMPPNLTPAQRAVAQALHDRCFPLLHGKGHQ